jgi:hypothetical protein
LAKEVQQQFFGHFEPKECEIVRLREAKNRDAEHPGLSARLSCMPMPGRTMTPICSTSSMASFRLNATPCGWLRVSRDREHGFHRIVSNDFRGS